MLRILLNFFLITFIQADLMIKPSAPSLTRDQHRSFVALCSGDSSINPIGWRSPRNEEIPENDNDRVTIERQNIGIRLRIRNLTLDDQGTWQCYGNDENGRVVEKVFNMNIRVPITFSSMPVQYAELNQSAVIQCRVQANPTAEIIWFKSNEKIRIIDDEIYQLMEGGLKLKRVDMSMNDTFWCRADVLETGESRDFPIAVIVSKSVTQINISCVEPCAIEKKTATLICQASGLPTPTYQWYFGSESLVSASEVPKLVVRGNQLTINYVDENDSGMYTCHAFNEFDKEGQRAQYNLNVIVPPKLSRMNPVEIQYEPEKSQQVTFECRIERGSSVDLIFEWRHMNQTPIISMPGVTIEQRNNETSQAIELRFDPVRREHFGNYSCFAKNLADEVSSSVSLFIQFAPVYIGPNVNTVSTIPNIRTTMRCQFESYPTPQIQWIKMSRTVQDPEGRILAVGIDQGVNDISMKQLAMNIYESVLSYTPNERDFGLTFECRALNPRLGRHAFTLQRAQPPKKVNITEIKIFATYADIYVQLSNASDLPVVQWIVKYDLQESDEDDWRSVIFPAELFVEQQKLKLDDLRPSTNYQFTIVAESQAGIGQVSAPISFRTLDRQRVDFTIDQHENETCFDDQTCSISWSILSDGGAPIIRSEITYGLAKDDGSLDVKDSFGASIVLDPTITEHEFNELKPSTSYVVLVKIYNDAGIAEQKIFMRTKSESSDSIIRRKNKIVNEYRKNQPMKWIAIGITLIAGLSFLVFVGIYVTLRVRRTLGKDATGTNDQQTTPMMSADDQSEKNNGAHPVSSKLVNAV